MRNLTCMMLTVVLLVTGSIAAAQPGRPRSDAVSQSTSGDDLVARMMVYDKNKDGKLTKDEITDERLHRLFDRSDANKDGTVTKAELASLAARQPAMIRGGGPGGGPGGFMMGMPRPGEILPPMFQQRLQLTAEQKAQLSALQKDVDGKLEQILNDDQKKQLKEIRERRPGGFGPPGGGPGGFGPRRGGPPGDGGPPPGPG
jgi:Ca2+-binding EF-hand superfamily protein